MRLSKTVALVVGMLTASSCYTTKKVAAKSVTEKKPSFLETANRYAKDGLLREAVDVYQGGLDKHPNHATAHRNLGLVLVRLGNFKSAAKHLEKSMVRFDRDHDANFYLGEAYRGAGNHAEAIFWYKKSLRLKKDHVPTLKALAWSYHSIRYYSQSLKAARRAYGLAPQDHQTAIIIIRTLIKLKRIKVARRVLDDARSRAGKTAAPYLASVAGDILLEMGKISKAISAYRNAIRAQPLLAGALLGLGRCYLQTGNEKKAIEVLERAARIRPRLKEIFFYLGQAYEDINPRKSVRYYHTFRKKASADPEYVGLLDWLEKQTEKIEAKIQ